MKNVDFIKKAIMAMVFMVVIPLTAMADGPYCNVVRNDNLNYQNVAYELRLYLGEDSGHGDDASASGCSMWSVNDFAKIYVDGKLACNIMDMMRNSSYMQYKGNLYGNNRYQIIGYWYNMEKWLNKTTTDNGDVITIGYIHHNGDDHEYWIYIGFIFKNNYVGKTHSITVDGSWINNGGTPTKKTWNFETKSINADKMPSSSDFTWSYNSNGTVTCNAENLQPLDHTGILENRNVYHYLRIYNGNNHLSDYSSGKMSSYIGGTWYYDYTTSFDVNAPVDYSKVNTLYPRFYRQIYYTNNDYGWGNEFSNYVNFIQDYSDAKHTVPCMPVPQNLKAEFDAWKKTIKLTWNSSFASTSSGQYTYDGDWAVFRTDANGKTTRIGQIDHQQNTSTSVEYTFTDTDNNLAYDSQYKYTVMFELHAWGDITTPDNSYLRRETKDIDTQRPFNIQSFEVTGQNDRVVAAWKILELTDASTSKPYTLQFLRRKNGETEWKTLKTKNITSPTETKGKFEDISTETNGIQPCDDAEYAIKIENVLGKTYSKGLEGGFTASLTGSTHVTELTTTYGDFSNMVRVNWKAEIIGNNNAIFTLYRRKLGTDGDWKTIYTIEGTASTYSYDDISAKPGDYYEYRVTCSTTCNGEVSEAQSTVGSYIDSDGFSLASGTVNGRIYYDSGTAVEGVKVMLVPNSEGGEDTFFAMKTPSSGNSSVSWSPSDNEVDLEQLIGNDKPWTLQMYIKPEKCRDPNVLATIGDNFILALDYNPYNTTFYPFASFTGQLTNTPLRMFAKCTLQIDRWYFLTFSFDPQDNTITITVKDDENNLQIQTNYPDNKITGKISVGDSFKGSIEDVRLFAREPSSGNASAVSWSPSDNEADLEQLIGNDKPWTMQTYVKPEACNNPTSVLAEIGDNVIFGLMNLGNIYCVPCVSFTGNLNTKLMFAKSTLQIGRWYFLSVSFNPQNNTITLTVKDDENNLTVETISPNDWNTYNMTGGISVGSNSFNGCIDDVRLFARELSETEIQRYSEHPLAGTEKDLILYWTFDEGINGQMYAYDYSTTDGVHNNRRGIITNLIPTNETPSNNMFSLCGYTDSEGNYTITGVPFSGDGRNYSVVPMLGAHEFNPSSVNRMVSINDMVHNGIDFKDISSFKVSGTIWYEHTNVPVKGAMIYVDGNLASKDGEAISTDENGEFTVDVPIGDHFISAKLNGHTFVNGGRFPVDKDGVGVRYTFTKDLSGLRFFDNTLVTVAGRVAGGNQEEAKPLGFDSSEANMGAATIRLSIANDEGRHYLNVNEVVDETSVSYEPSDTELELQSASDYVTSSAKVGAKVGDNPEQCKYIVIQTDETSGEFAVKMPPLRYKVESVSTKSYDLSGYSFYDIDATNVNTVLTDSLEIDGSTPSTGSGTNSPQALKYFEYNAGWKYKYKATPTLYVEQTANSEEPELDVNEKHPWDGHFGDAIYNYETYDDLTQKYDTTKIELYSVDPETKQVKYNYNYPIFTQLGTYRFHIREYEEYINKDKDNSAKTNDEKTWVRSIVPLSGDTIVIKNEFASTAVVDSITYEYLTSLDDGKLGLDDNGEADYVFQAGLPKLIGDFSRAFSIQYGDNVWNQSNGFSKGIVMGLIPQGNNFVTGAPDDVTMILRKPGGSSSTATWESGKVTKHRTDRTRLFVSDNSTSLNVKTNVETYVASGVGVAVITTAKVITSNEETIKVSGSVGTRDSETTTTSITQSISTPNTTNTNMLRSGYLGDIFVGVSRNTIIGEAKDVAIRKQEDGSFRVGVADILTKGSEFTTTFAYSQNQIINQLLPDFKDLRNQLIEPVGTPQTAYPKKYRYISKVPTDDPHFGEDGYVISIAPTGLAEGEGAEDEVQYYNSQITGWERYLRENEEAKINAIKNCQDKVKNYSFDAGSMITNSYLREHTASDGTVGTERTSFAWKSAGGGEIQGVGTTLTTNFDEGFYGEWSSDDETTDYAKFSYTLAETGKDYLTVDVYENTDKYGSPIFVTRGGMTSCPYEDEYKAIYADDKETVLSAKTIQKNNPFVEITNPIVTSVPSGEAAIINLKCSNISPVSGSDYFNLEIIEGSNPDGLELMLDGQAITSGRTIWVVSNEEISKTLSVRQTNPDILEYRNVGVRLSTSCFHDQVSEAYFDVSFLPAGANITLSSSTDLVNSNTIDDLKLYLSDYNINSASLDRVELQYRMGSGAWSNLKTYVKPGDERLTSAPQLYAELITLGSSEDNKHLVFPIALTNESYADGTYQFRAQTICKTSGGTEVSNSSEVITVIRDIHAPQPLGNPTPTNGVLASGDDISITFNKDIQMSGIVKGTNIVVTGLLNDSKVSHDVAAQFITASNTAKTQSAINLSQRSFTIGAWIYVDETGTLLTHGSADEKLTLAITSDKKLQVKMGEKEMTTEETIPMKKWIYVSVVYENDDPSTGSGQAEDDNDDDNNATLTAYFAYDSTDGNVKMNGAGEYLGNGSLAIGGFSGRMHELTLWNRAMTWTEQRMDMDTKKNRYTPDLIGYWPMNEGQGSVAEDFSRNRHITLPSANAWAMATENYAAKTGSDHIVVMPVENPCRADESYVIEEWFRADNDNDNENPQPSTLLAFSNGKLSISLNARGGMVVTTAEGAKTISSKDWRDGTWHHLAMATRLSTGGVTTFLVDGNALYQMPATSTPAMSTSQLWAGGEKNNVKTLKGAIDEVRVWKGIRTVDVIKENRLNRIRAVDEPSLILYYPFEKITLDETNVASVAPSVTNQANGCTTHLEDESLTITNQGALGMKTAKVKENVDFSFVANERKIVITPEAEAQRLEGCTLTFETRYLQDVNGNYADNVTWTAYVQQNNLKWAESEVSVRKVGTEAVSKTVTIVNRSAMRQDFVLTGLPTWLTASTDAGYVEPLESKTVELTVNPGTPVGKHEVVIYLTGTLGISEPLFFSLTSAGDVPDWTVNTGKYESSMNIIGQIKIDGSLSTDEEDMIAAFIGNECRGVAHPQYISRDDSYYLLLNVYADGKDADAVVTYKMYDASSGIIYPTITAGTFDSQITRYIVDGVIGSMNEPVTWSPLANVEQHIYMHDGWNWISFNVKPDDYSLTAVFGEDLSRINTIKDKNSSYADGWGGSLQGINPSSMYKVNVKDGRGGLFTFVGKRAQNETITLNNKWNWISYPLTTVMSLDDAFSGAQPEEGDVVKSQTQFSVYDNGTWVGSLVALNPGEGYLYNSNDSESKSFTYPEYNEVSYARKILKRAEKPVATQSLGIHENNMSVMAVVKDGEDVVKNAIVRVYDADGTCCGQTDACIADTLHFITVGCNETAAGLYVTVQQIGKDEKLISGRMIFNADDICGSVANPLVIQLNGATGIESVYSNGEDDTAVYDLTGRRVDRNANKTGIYIKNKRKVLINSSSIK